MNAAYYIRKTNIVYAMRKITMFSQNNPDWKQFFRLPKFCLQFLLILYFFKPAYCQAQVLDRNIGISLSCFKEQVGYSEPNKITPKLIPVTDANFLDPIILKFTITNKTQKDISVLYSDFRSKIIKLKLIDISMGQQVQEQVRWDMGSSDFVEIQQGKTFDVLLYIEQLYPDGISSGDYELKLEYAPYGKAWLQTNSIFLSFKPQNKQQNENYLKFVRGFEMKEDIELFLKENPVGLYRSRIYERIASEQIRLKKYEDAIKTIDKIISGNTTTTYQKGKALELKAGILREYLGKQEEALKCIEKSPLRSSHLQAELWKKIYISHSPNSQ
jgi:tetratricopeptide (TPR) repeat protein